MKVGIIHGAAVYGKKLAKHTKARADVGIKAWDCGLVDLLIVSGKKEADAIARYVAKEIGKENVLVEKLSYSTLSNLYFSGKLLALFEGVDEVLPISNYWHLPRLHYDATHILRKYRIRCLGAPDPRSEEVKKDKLLEIPKLVLDRCLIALGYGEDLKYLPPFEISLSQARLMKLERKLLNLLI